MSATEINEELAAELRLCLTAGVGPLLGLAGPRGRGHEVRGPGGGDEEAEEAGDPAEVVVAAAEVGDLVGGLRQLGQLRRVGGLVGEGLVGLGGAGRRGAL